MSTLLKTGKSYRIKRQSGTAYHLGGVLERLRLATENTEVEEDATGQFQLALHKQTEIKPALELTLKLQRLGNYVADYAGTNKFCFVSNEGAQSLTSNVLVVTDETNAYHMGNGGIVDSCRLEIDRASSLKAVIRVLSKGMTATTYGSDPTPITDHVLTINNVNALTIGGVSMLPYLQRAVFTVNHGGEQVVLGNTNTVTDVLQKSTHYTIELTRAFAAGSLFDTVLGGTRSAVVLQINDNQTPTPTKTKFTFNDVDWTRYEQPVEELNLILETLTGKCKNLTLAAGT